MDGGGNQDSQCQLDTVFMNYTGLREPFLSSDEENRAAWIKAKIDQHKAKQTQQLHNEELPTLKLVFANEVRQPMYTGQNITDKHKMPIKIQLIYINTGRQCTNVEGLNIKVKIVVIDGDLEVEGLDSDKFKSKIVKQREGKRPLLVGNTEVTFNQQGVGTIGDLYFTDNSKWLRSGKFRLGACIDSKRCGTIINIQEGLSAKFRVKDQRGLPYEKRYPPMLNDDVWRLESISKNGKYHQKLKDKNINSVQDLLKLLNANPNGLKEEPPIQSEKVDLEYEDKCLEQSVKHAQTCHMDLDSTDLPNYSHMTEISGLEPNPMPEFQPNMCMGQQRDPAAHLVSDQMEHVPPISSLNENNGPSEAFGQMPGQPEMPEQASAVQEMTMDNDSNWNQGLDFDGLDFDEFDQWVGGTVEALLINDDHAL